MSLRWLVHSTFWPLPVVRTDSPAICPQDPHSRTYRGLSTYTRTPRNAQHKKQQNFRKEAASSKESVKLSYFPPVHVDLCQVCSLQGTPPLPTTTTSYPTWNKSTKYVLVRVSYLPASHSHSVWHFSWRQKPGQANDGSSRGGKPSALECTFCWSYLIPKSAWKISFLLWKAGLLIKTSRTEMWKSWTKAAPVPQVFLASKVVWNGDPHLSVHVLGTKHGRALHWEVYLWFPHNVRVGAGLLHFPL